MVNEAWAWQLLQIAWSCLIFSALGIRSQMTPKLSLCASPTRHDMTTILPKLAAFSMKGTAYKNVSVIMWPIFTYVFVELSLIDSNHVCFFPAFTQLSECGYCNCTFFNSKQFKKVMDQKCKVRSMFIKKRVIRYEMKTMAKNRGNQTVKAKSENCWIISLKLFKSTYLSCVAMHSWL